MIKRGKCVFLHHTVHYIFTDTYIYSHAETKQVYSNCTCGEDEERGEYVTCQVKRCTNQFYERVQ